MFVERFLEWVETATTVQRAEAANPLVEAYFSSKLDEQGLEETEAALTLLLDDKSPDVRMALAEALVQEENAPRHLILSLVNDTPEIATYVLTRSPVFVSGELVDLAATGTPEQQIAIACRNNIGPSVAAAIAEVSCEEACLAMLMNEEAIISTYGMKRLAERFGENAETRELLFARPDLPPEVHVMLVEKLGSALGGFAESNNWLSKMKSEEAIVEACDKAAITYIANSSDADIDRITANLIERGKITPGFLLRAICMGNITLFSRTISQLAEMPASKIDNILSGNRTSALKAAYVKSGLPERAFEVFECAISSWRTHLTRNVTVSSSRMAVLVTREVLSKYTKNQDRSLDDLLVLLRKLSAEASLENAKSKVAEVHEKRRREQLAAIEAQELEKTLIEDFQLAFEEELLEHEVELTAELETDLAEAVSAEVTIGDGIDLNGDGSDSAGEEISLSNDEVKAFPRKDRSGPSIVDAITAKPLEMDIAA